MSVDPDSTDESSAPPFAVESTAPRANVLVRRHLAIGWWSLLLFLTLGVVLEYFHGFKTRWYLDLDNETRRMMWRLAHAHGGLIAIIHLAFAATFTAVPGAASSRAMRIASPCLIVALVLLPAGFLLGGFYTHGADPGLGIFLVPVGAAFLFVGILLTALGHRAT